MKSLYFAFCLSLFAATPRVIQASASIPPAWPLPAFGVANRCQAPHRLSMSKASVSVYNFSLPDGWAGLPGSSTLVGLNNMWYIMANSNDLAPEGWFADWLLTAYDPAAKAVAGSLANLNSQPVILPNGTVVAQVGRTMLVGTDPMLNVLSATNFTGWIAFFWPVSNWQQMVVGWCNYTDVWQCYMGLVQLKNMNFIWTLPLATNGILFGSTSAPAVSDDGRTLYFTYSGNQGNVTALHIATGRILWTRPVPDSSCFIGRSSFVGSPVVLGCADGSGDQALILTCEASSGGSAEFPIFGVNATDGSLLWRYAPPAWHLMTTSVVACGHPEYKQGLLITGVESANSNYFHWIAVDVGTGQRLSPEPFLSSLPLANSLADLDGTVFVVAQMTVDGHRSSVLLGIDPVTNRTLSKTTLGPSAFQAGQPAVTADGHYVTWIDWGYPSFVEIKPLGRTLISNENIESGR